MYNPWSILNFLQHRELEAYWVKTSSNFLIKEALKNTNLDVNKVGEYVNYWENNELTRFRGITLKEAMYFLTIKKPVFTFTAINNPVILTGYDSKTVTIYDINTSSIQKIDINEAQSIFNSTQNDFSCFFTFGM